MRSWDIGYPILKTIDLDKADHVKVIESEPASVAIEVKHRYHISSFTQRIKLDSGVPRIDIEMTADWREQGDKDTPAPMLKAAFPAALADPKATFEIPFGSIERPANGQEVPALKWIDLSDNSFGLSLLNNCKYGYDVKDNVMRITLLRCPYIPDPKPDQGVHHMTYSLYPHSGSWQSAGSVRRSYELNSPLIALPATAKHGTLQPAHCFVSLTPDNLVVTALKKAEDSDNLILRFYNTTGQSTVAKVELGIPARQWRETDLIERPLGKFQQMTNGAFSLSIAKYDVMAVEIKR
jgi:alpha-mannosidase